MRIHPEDTVPPYLLKVDTSNVVRHNKHGCEKHGCVGDWGCASFGSLGAITDHSLAKYTLVMGMRS